MDNFNFDLDSSIDEGFFGSLNSKSSKLQQLFGEDALTMDDKQQSLKYQRPKTIDFKNKELKNVSNATTASSTLLAKVVTLYRQGELQGKVGLALIQNPDDSNNLIVYKTKNYILTTFNLVKSQDLLYKRTKYWQFYDENTIYWSFSFECLNDEEEFINKLQSKGIGYKETQENENMENDKELDKFNNETQSVADDTSQETVNKSKSMLIKRITKMGRPLPTLPTTQQQTTTDLSDSSDTEVLKTPLVSTPKPAVAQRSSKLSSTKPNQQIVSSMATYSVAAPNTSAIYSINPLESQYMHMLLSEQRNQSTELRMNMNKLENKIEKVLDKLEIHHRLDGKQMPEKDDEILELEEKLLTLKKENRKLKQNLQDLSSNKSEENKLEGIINEFKPDLNHLKIDYKQDFKSILRQLIDNLQESLKTAQTNQEQLLNSEIKFKEHQKEMNLQMDNNLQLEKELKSLKQRESDIKLELKEMETKVEALKNEVKSLNTQLQERKEETVDTAHGAVVKSIMNSLYGDISDKLQNSDLPQATQIMSLIAASIKQQTLKSLDQMKT